MIFSLERRRRLEWGLKHLTITNRRAIYLDKKIFGRYDLEDMPYEKMKNVRFYHGLIGSEFKLTNEDGSIIKVDWLHKERCKSAIETIRDELNKIAVEPVTISKKQMILGREEWNLKKPEEAVYRQKQSEPTARPRNKVAEKSKTSTEEKPMEKLKKLKELYDEGIINEKEYQEKKDKLMELI